ncbi:MAG: hypothetical protein OQJ95_06495 [Kangiella sp.]|nr:hypothetical protein [Kangiella sp.]MCW9029230.1 hypothetical protein [Kangiella sp.]
MNTEQVKVKQGHCITNEQLKISMGRANKCVQELVSRGFKVLLINEYLHFPRIVVANSVLCSELDGRPKVRKKIHGVYMRQMAAFFMDCQVEWTEIGH